ncbi:DUF6270 domain-containing protein [Promicromonospora sp. NPDC057488]|uniref:DUF6270 domain-containing protein n=1 Tax=Promicromonospora sp. NPDC057488 TaxID=3346147 RepID=UPI00366ECFA6
MSKTRVFIYGSCVSRDTFEHFDPEEFALVEYVARQSVLSAYTKPVELMAPPTLGSRFQQRMVTGDFSSSLRSLLATHGSATDLVLVDLTDERLGAYLLPDGSMVTRSVELIESGAEQHLPQGTQHVAFGTQQHFDYWSTAMNYIGERVQHYMPQATIVLLDIPWAEWSESGNQTPDSFGVRAADANPVFRPYIEIAAQALGAHVVSLDPAEVMSGPHHPWGDAPFHYAEKVYLEIVRRLTGAEGRVVWGPTATPRGTGSQPSVSSPASDAQPQAPTSGAHRQLISSQADPEPSEESLVANQVAAIHAVMKDALPGDWRRHWIWSQGPASVHEFISGEATFAFDVSVNGNVCDIQFLPRDKSQIDSFMQRIRTLGIEWFAVADKDDRVSIVRESIPDGIVSDKWVRELRDRISSVRESFEAPSDYQARKIVANQVAAIHATMKDVLPGRWQRHWIWSQGPTSVHEFISGETTFAFDISVEKNVCDIQFLPRDKAQFETFMQRIRSAGIEWFDVPAKDDRVSITIESIPDGIVSDKWVRELCDRVSAAREAFEAHSAAGLG